MPAHTAQADSPPKRTVWEYNSRIQHWGGARAEAHLCTGNSGRRGVWTAVCPTRHGRQAGAGWGSASTRPESSRVTAHTCAGEGESSSFALLLFGCAGQHPGPAGAAVSISTAATLAGLPCRKACRAGLPAESCRSSIIPTSVTASTFLRFIDIKPLTGNFIQKLSTHSTGISRMKTDPPAGLSS